MHAWCSLIGGLFTESHFATILVLRHFRFPIVINFDGICSAPGVGTTSLNFDGAWHRCIVMMASHWYTLIWYLYLKAYIIWWYLVLQCPLSMTSALHALSVVWARTAVWGLWLDPLTHVLMIYKLIDPKISGSWLSSWYITGRGVRVTFKMGRMDQMSVMRYGRWTAREKWDIAAVSDLMKAGVTDIQMNVCICHTTI